MKNTDVLTKTELASILRTSSQTISNQIYLGREGVTIPPSLQLGKKRLWLRSTVFTWLKEKEAQTPALKGASSKANNLFKERGITSLSDDFKREARSKTKK